MLRAVVAFSFLLVSTSVMGAAFWVGAGTPVGTLLINLGTELFGILVTVAVVEWFFDRRRLQDRGREISWNVLHAIERGVWVWQGGPRQLGSDELLGLISGIRSKDPMQSFTQLLIQSAGSQAREALQKDPKSLKTLPGLTEAMTDLASLVAIKDGGSVSVRMVAEILESATSAIAGVLGQPTARMPAALIWYRDASNEKQEQRYYEIRPRVEGAPPVADDARGIGTEPRLA